jgi:hypothetical protein
MLSESEDNAFRAQMNRRKEISKPPLKPIKKRFATFLGGKQPSQEKIQTLDKAI